MSFFHLVDDITCLNQMHAGWTATKVCSAVNSISEQINLFKCQSSVCVCVSVCKLRKLLVYYVTFVFSITVLWVLKYKIVVIVYCDVVNILPHFNFCNEIIILNAWAIFKNCLQKGMAVGNFCSCSTSQCLWFNLPCVPLYDHPVVTATSSRLKLTSGCCSHGGSSGVACDATWPECWKKGARGGGGGGGGDAHVPWTPFYNSPSPHIQPPPPQPPP